MNDEERNKKGVLTIRLPLPTSKDLRGRQSVRATFRLSERAIQAISAVALHLGIKQKSLFDHLIDDPRTLEAVADEVRSEDFSSLERVQKTYVISRRTLVCLEETAKTRGTPRDALVEYSIQRLMPVIARERRRHRRRKQVLAEMSAYVRAGEELLQRAAKSLGEEDPVTEWFADGLAALEAGRRQAEELVRRGEAIEGL
jgi:ubiquinone/menaquinone biosynthesis C-methylase UbiE